MLTIMNSLHALLMIPALWQETHDLVVRHMVESFFVDLSSHSVKLFLLVFCESGVGPFHPVARVFTIGSFFQILKALWILQIFFLIFSLIMHAIEEL